MNDTRSTVRRVVQILALSAGILVPYLSGRCAQMVAAYAPIVTGAIHYKYVPAITEAVLRWVPSLSTLGGAASAALAIATATLFSLSKNEDTRLQATVVITAVGYAVALMLIMVVAFALVAIPGVFNAA